MRRVLAAAVVIVACSAPPQGEVEALLLDEAAYARDVHPIFERRCASLDCHGRWDQPLRLYAETGLRARGVPRSAPITDEELSANVRAVSAIDPLATPDDHLVMTKALGRVAHEGGVRWRRVDEPQAICVAGWLAGASEDPGVAAACVAAAAEVELPPPRRR